MKFFQAYQDVGDGKTVSLGPYRESTLEAVRDLMDNGFHVDDLYEKKGIRWSDSQNVGISITYV